MTYAWAGGEAGVRPLAGHLLSLSSVKFKITKSQEFVIGGYTVTEGRRKYFGSLLVGYQSPDELLSAGSQTTLPDLILQLF